MPAKLRCNGDKIGKEAHTNIFFCWYRDIYRRDECPKRQNKFVLSPYCLTSEGLEICDRESGIPLRK